MIFRPLLITLIIIIIAITTVAVSALYDGCPGGSLTVSDITFGAETFQNVNHCNITVQHVVATSITFSTAIDMSNITIDNVTCYDDNVTGSSSCVKFGSAISNAGNLIFRNVRRPNVNISGSGANDVFSVVEYGGAVDGVNGTWLHELLLFSGSISSSTGAINAHAVDVRSTLSQAVSFEISDSFVSLDMQTTSGSAASCFLARLRGNIDSHGTLTFTNNSMRGTSVNGSSAASVRGIWFERNVSSVVAISVDRLDISNITVAARSGWAGAYGVYFDGADKFIAMSGGSRISVKGVLLGGGTLSVGVGGTSVNFHIAVFRSFVGWMHSITIADCQVVDGTIATTTGTSSPIYLHLVHFTKPVSDVHTIQIRNVSVIDSNFTTHGSSSHISIFSCHFERVANVSQISIIDNTIHPATASAGNSYVTTSVVKAGAQPITGTRSNKSKIIIRGNTLSGPYTSGKGDFNSAVAWFEGAISNFTSIDVSNNVAGAVSVAADDGAVLLLIARFNSTITLLGFNASSAACAGYSAQLPCEGDPTGCTWQPSALCVPQQSLLNFANNTMHGNHLRMNKTTTPSNAAAAAVTGFVTFYGAMVDMGSVVVSNCTFEENHIETGGNNAPVELRLVHFVAPITGSVVNISVHDVAVTGTNNLFFAADNNTAATDIAVVHFNETIQQGKDDGGSSSSSGLFLSLRNIRLADSRISSVGPLVVAAVRIGGNMSANISHVRALEVVGVAVVDVNVTSSACEASLHGIQIERNYIIMNGGDGGAGSSSSSSSYFFLSHIQLTNVVLLGRNQETRSTVSPAGTVYKVTKLYAVGVGGNELLSFAQTLRVRNIAITNATVEDKSAAGSSAATIVGVTIVTTLRPLRCSSISKCPRDIDVRNVSLSIRSLIAHGTFLSVHAVGFRKPTVASDVSRITVRDCSVVLLPSGQTTSSPIMGGTEKTQIFIYPIYFPTTVRCHILSIRNVVFDAVTSSSSSGIIRVGARTNLTTQDPIVTLGVVNIILVHFKTIEAVSMLHLHSNVIRVQSLYARAYSVVYLCYFEGTISGQLPVNDDNDPFFVAEKSNEMDFILDNCSILLGGAASSSATTTTSSMMTTMIVAHSFLAVTLINFQGTISNSNFTLDITNSIINATSIRSIASTVGVILTRTVASVDFLASVSSRGGFQVSKSSKLVVSNATSRGELMCTMSLFESTISGLSMHAISSRLDWVDSTVHANNVTSETARVRVSIVFFRQAVSSISQLQLRRCHMHSFVVYSTAGVTVSPYAFPLDFWGDVSSINNVTLDAVLSNATFSHNAGGGAAGHFHTIHFLKKVTSVGTIVVKNSVVALRVIGATQGHAHETPGIRLNGVVQTVDAIRIYNVSATVSIESSPVYQVIRMVVTQQPLIDVARIELDSTSLIVTEATGAGAQTTQINTAHFIQSVTNCGVVSVRRCAIEVGTVFRSAGTSHTSMVRFDQKATNDETTKPLVLISEGNSIRASHLETGGGTIELYMLFVSATATVFHNVSLIEMKSNVASITSASASTSVIFHMCRFLSPSVTFSLHKHNSKLSSGMMVFVNNTMRVRNSMNATSGGVSLNGIQFEGAVSGASYVLVDGLLIDAQHVQSTGSGVVTLFGMLFASAARLSLNPHPTEQQQPNVTVRAVTLRGGTLTHEKSNLVHSKLVVFLSDVFVFSDHFGGAFHVENCVMDLGNMSIAAGASSGKHLHLFVAQVSKTLPHLIRFTNNTIRVESLFCGKAVPNCFAEARILHGPFLPFSSWYFGNNTVDVLHSQTTSWQSIQIVVFIATIGQQYHQPAAPPPPEQKNETRRCVSFVGNTVHLGSLSAGTVVHAAVMWAVAAASIFPTDYDYAISIIGNTMRIDRAVGSIGLTELTIVNVKSPVASGVLLPQSSSSSSHSHMQILIEHNSMVVKKAESVSSALKIVGLFFDGEVSNVSSLICRNTSVTIDGGNRSHIAVRSGGGQLDVALAWFSKPLWNVGLVEWRQVQLRVLSPVTSRGGDLDCFLLRLAGFANKSSTKELSEQSQKNSRRSDLIVANTTLHVTTSDITNVTLTWRIATLWSSSPAEDAASFWSVLQNVSIENVIHEVDVAAEARNNASSSSSLSSSVESFVIFVDDRIQNSTTHYAHAAGLNFSWRDVRATMSINAPGRVVVSAANFSQLFVSSASFLFADTSLDIVARSQLSSVEAALIRSDHTAMNVTTMTFERLDVRANVSCCTDSRAAAAAVMSNNKTTLATFSAIDFASSTMQNVQSVVVENMHVHASVVSGESNNGGGLCSVSVQCVKMPGGGGGGGGVVVTEQPMMVLVKNVSLSLAALSVPNTSLLRDAASAVAALVRFSPSSSSLLRLNLTILGSRMLSNVSLSSAIATTHNKETFFDCSSSPLLNASCSLVRFDHDDAHGEGDGGDAPTLLHMNLTNNTVAAGAKMLVLFNASSLSRRRSSNSSSLYMKGNFLAPPADIAVTADYPAVISQSSSSSSSSSSSLSSSLLRFHLHNMSVAIDCNYWLRSTERRFVAAAAPTASTVALYCPLSDTPSMSRSFPSALSGGSASLSAGSPSPSPLASMSTPEMSPSESHTIIVEASTTRSTKSMKQSESESHRSTSASRNDTTNTLERNSKTLGPGSATHSKSETPEIPPVPIPKRPTEIVKEYVSVVTAVATATVGSVAQAGTGTTQGIFNTFSKFAECTPTLAEPLPFIESPTGLAVVMFRDADDGDANSKKNNTSDRILLSVDAESVASFQLRFHIGGMLGNLAICAGVITLSLLVAFAHGIVLSYRTRNKSSADDNAKKDNGKKHADDDDMGTDEEEAQTNRMIVMMSSLAFARFPSALVPFFALLVAPTIGSCVTTLVYSTFAGAIALAVGLLLLTILVSFLLLVNVLLPRRFLATFRTSLAVLAAKAKQVHPDGRFRGGLTAQSAIFDADGTWFDVPQLVINADPQHPSEAAMHTPIPELESDKHVSTTHHDFCRRFASLFDCYVHRRHWYFCVDVAMAVLCGVVSGMIEKFGCTVGASVALVLSVIYLGVFLRLKPLALPFETYCVFVVQILMVGTSACAVAVAALPESSSTTSEQQQSGTPAPTQTKVQLLTAMDIMTTVALIVTLLQIVVIAILDFIIEPLSETGIRRRVAKNTHDIINKRKVHQKFELRVNDFGDNFSESSAVGGGENQSRNNDDGKEEGKVMATNTMESLAELLLIRDGNDDDGDDTTEKKQKEQEQKQEQEQEQEQQEQEQQEMKQLPPTAEDERRVKEQNIIRFLEGDDDEEEPPPEDGGGGIKNEEAASSSALCACVTCESFAAPPSSRSGRSRAASFRDAPQQPAGVAVTVEEVEDDDDDDDDDEDVPPPPSPTRQRELSSTNPRPPKFPDDELDTYIDQGEL